jgi:hypothetical protein
MWVLLLSINCYYFIHFAFYAVSISIAIAIAIVIAVVIVIIIVTVAIVVVTVVVTNSDYWVSFLGFTHTHTPLLTYLLKLH